MKLIKYMIKKTTTSLSVKMLRNIEKYKKNSVALNNPKLIFKSSNKIVENVLKAYYELIFKDLKILLIPSCFGNRYGLILTYFLSKEINLLKSYV